MQLSERTLLQRLHEEAESSAQISADTLHMMIQEQSNTTVNYNRMMGKSILDWMLSGCKPAKGVLTHAVPTKSVMCNVFLQSDISFGIGPAGTGKTYLAVAAAVDMLERNEIQRILLVRPAVEAGEKLGFLPGDLTQKIDPYLRPLYDALYEMLGFEKVAKLIERQVIEVAPLAYMRGRTLNHSFVILDEAQNTTLNK